jgi:hypothetical protein
MATRMYIPNLANDSGLTPAMSGWQTTSPNRYQLTRSKVSSAALIRSLSTGIAGPREVGFIQAISEPLFAQTISGTVRGVFGAAESNAAADYNAQMNVRVIDSTGATRGSLLLQQTDALNNEFAVSTSVMTSRYFSAGTSAKSMTSVVAQAGDRLVVELGYRRHVTTTTSYAGYIQIGGLDTVADRALNQTATVGVGWVEFSGDILFDIPNTEPVISVPPTVSYTPLTRLGPNNTPATVTFTATDTEETTANALSYTIRTAAAGGGTLVGSGTCTSGISKSHSITNTNAGLVDGTNTLYLRISDGTLFSSDAAFTLLRDTGLPTVGTITHTPNPVT